MFYNKIVFRAAQLVAGVKILKQISKIGDCRKILGTDKSKFKFSSGVATLFLTG